MTSFTHMKPAAANMNVNTLEFLQLLSWLFTNHGSSPANYIDLLCSNYTKSHTHSHVPGFQRGISMTKLSCVPFSNGAAPESISAANSQNIASFGTKLIVFNFQYMLRETWKIHDGCCWKRLHVHHVRIMSLLSPKFKDTIWSYKHKI